MRELVILCDRGCTQGGRFVRHVEDKLAEKLHTPSPIHFGPVATSSLSGHMLRMHPPDPPFLMVPLRHKVKRHALLDDRRCHGIQQRDVPSHSRRHPVAEPIQQALVGHDARVQAGEAHRLLGHALAAILIPPEHLLDTPSIRPLALSHDKPPQPVGQLRDPLPPGVEPQAGVGRHLVHGVAHQHDPLVVPLVHKAFLEVQHLAPPSRPPQVAKRDLARDLVLRERGGKPLGVLVRVPGSLARGLLEVDVHDEVCRVFPGEDGECLALGLAAYLVTCGGLEAVEQGDPADEAVVVCPHGLVLTRAASEAELAAGSLLLLLGAQVVHHLSDGAVHTIAADDDAAGF
ncbi:hypothetical protein VM1G_07286 [Cytospora mali]|uniref:Uncharacterized protein n=1 Tax=Cytospora mali TaxID=578113 RepID=A0A194W4V7_CYTMA|nr:hypothetical protein VM1G_07286 [Valsa mali]